MEILFQWRFAAATNAFWGQIEGKHCRGQIILTRESQRRKTIFYRAKTLVHWSRHSISYGQSHRTINSLTRNLKRCALFVVNLQWFSKMSPFKTAEWTIFCHFLVVTRAQLVVQCIFWSEAWWINPWSRQFVSQSVLEHVTEPQVVGEEHVAFWHGSRGDYCVNVCVNGWIKKKTLNPSQRMSLKCMFYKYVFYY